MTNIPYSLAAIVVLTILLGLAGWEIKHEIGRNATLANEVTNRDASIKRLSEQAQQEKLERQRVDRLLLARDSLKQGNEAKADTGKAAVRVAAKQSTRFGDCSGINVPADVVQRLRGQASGSPDTKAIPASDPAQRVSATFYP